MDGVDKWRERAVKLVRLINRMRPNEEFCWACGEYGDHADDCVSGELNAAIDEIKAANRDRFDPAG